MKKVTVYGVEMTSIQEIMFSKYRDNKGIAMNTLRPEERKKKAQDWLSDQK